MATQGLSLPQQAGDSKSNGVAAILRSLGLNRVRHDIGRVGPSESRMWSITESKPSGGPPECGHHPVPRASNREGSDAHARATIPVSGGPRLGQSQSDPRVSLALAPPYTQNVEDIKVFQHARLPFKTAFLLAVRLLSVVIGRSLATAQTIPSQLTALPRHWSLRPRARLWWVVAWHHMAAAQERLKSREVQVADPRRHRIWDATTGNGGTVPFPPPG